MRIGARIGTGFLIPLLFVLVIGISAYVSTAKVKETNGWVTHSFEVMNGTETVLALLVEAESAERGFVITGDDEFLHPAPEEAGRRVHDQIETLRRLTADNPVQQARVASLDRIASDRIEALRLVAEARRRAGPQEAAAVIKQKRGKQTMDEVRRIADEMKTEETRLLREREGDAALALSWAQSIAVGGAALLFVIVVGGIAVVTRSLTRPIGRVMEGVDRISKGDLASRIPVEGNDEVTALAQAFNRMTEARQRAEAQVAEESAGRKRTLDAVIEVINTLSSASAELLASTTEQASGTQEQSAAVSQVVATVNEVAQTAEQSADRARQVAESALRSDEIAAGGRRAVDDSVSVLDRAKSQADDVAQNILALAEQTQTIGEVLSTINDLADQTNLLSLNAAVEAARAGEQGRGFQAVAGQIKELAAQSKQATVQVRRILSDVQKVSNRAVLSTEEGTRSMNAAVKAAQDAGETIRTLAEITSEVAQSVTQISASAGQQSTGMTQINQAMRNINQVTQQQLVATRQTEQTAQALSALGTRLKQLVAG
jgi:methyl-accepting chemotaxis protein